MNWPTENEILGPSLCTRAPLATGHDNRTKIILDPRELLVFAILTCQVVLQTTIRKLSIPHEGS
jgi:hypothetical protein